MSKKQATGVDTRAMLPLYVSLFVSLCASFFSVDFHTCAETFPASGDVYLLGDGAVCKKHTNQY